MAIEGHEGMTRKHAKPLRRVVAGLGVAVFVLTAGCGGPARSGRTTPRNRGWVIVEPPREGFVVEMPREPSLTEAKGERQYGHIDRTIYHARDRGGEIDFYLVRTVYAKGSFDGTYTHEQALSDLRREFVEERQAGDVEKTWFIKMKKADKATMFIFRTDEDRVFWRVRQAIRGEVAYQVAYATPDKKLRETGAHYLRSFALY